LSAIALIQARVGSTRLPGKVLENIRGKPMIARVVDRVRAARRVTGIRVVTSSSPKDDSLVAWARSTGVDVSRGSEDDVLDRFHSALEDIRADCIVRVTADCPLLDPEIVDSVIRKFDDGAFDYVSNCLHPTYPDGLDTEVIARPALEKAWREARLPSEREHVTPFIWKHPEIFSIGEVRHFKDLSAMRWTVDEREDLAFVRRIYEATEGDVFGMDLVLRVLETHPEIAAVNLRFRRNEGYAKSVSGEVSP
jgi:spore coat polysaccharide biosynthesis protein SpsF